MIKDRSTPLPVSGCCRLLSVSRASVYRPAPKEAAADPELEVLAARHPRYGYRRLSVLLGSTPKKTRAAMRKAGLQAARKRRRARTAFPVPADAPNLAFVPTGPGQLLASDFTYLPLATGFAFYAVTLDVYSRRLLGWSISRGISTQPVLQALRMALGGARLAPGWVHHSDRGSQYASKEFRELVASSGGRASFSRPASPQDNCFVESFFARFKDEELRTREIRTFDQAADLVSHYGRLYNEIRPHSSLGNLTPATYESLC